MHAVTVALVAYNTLIIKGIRDAVAHGGEDKTAFATVRSLKIYPGDGITFFVPSIRLEGRRLDGADFQRIYPGASDHRIFRTVALLEEWTHEPLLCELARCH